MRRPVRIARAVTGGVLALSALVPLGAAVPSHAGDGLQCSKSEPVATGPTFVSVGPYKKTLIGKHALLVPAKFIIFPGTPTCVGGPISCPSTATRCEVVDYYFTGGYSPFGTASSSSGGAGVEVLLQTRLTGGGQTWDTIGRTSCRVGTQLSKSQSCDTNGGPSLLGTIRPGSDARIVCSWKSVRGVVDKNPTVDCRPVFATYFDYGG